MDENTEMVLPIEKAEINSLKDLVKAMVIVTPPPPLSYVEKQSAEELEAKEPGVVAPGATHVGCGGHWQKYK